MQLAENSTSMLGWLGFHTRLVQRTCGIEVASKLHVPTPQHIANQMLITTFKRLVGQ